MQANCPLSCGVCSPTTPAPPQPTPGPQPPQPTPGPQPPQPTPAPQPCTDENQMCPDWAAIGECEANPDYMEANCALSCGVCGTNPSPQPQPTPTPVFANPVEQ